MPIEFENKEYQEKQLRGIIVNEAEENAQKVAGASDLPYINLSFRPIQSQALSIVPEGEARKANLAVILRRVDSITAVVRDPTDAYAKKILENLKTRFAQVVVYVVSQYSLEKAWSNYSKGAGQEKISGTLAISRSVFEQFKQRISYINDIREAVAEVSQRQNASVIVELLLAGSIQLNASDIHIEPAEETAHLRLRIDGLMHETSELDSHVYRILLSRIKLLSNLKLNVHNAAQDGRFSVDLGDFEIQIRTSVLPGEYGENVVLRILNPQSLLSLEELGIREDLHAVIVARLKRPTGMILATGPTGSGKTTTLYAFLKKLQTPELKIITVEDPIEYHIEGISQTQVAPEKGYTFANGLRAILRQDPDIILVGEIRDLETADTALQASLTGHLLLSTLHTNDAAGIVPRLSDIGASPATIGPALSIAIAQRLVRKLCVNCKIFRKVTAEEITLLHHVLSTLPENVHLPKKVDGNLEIAEANKCENCHQSGYKGRIGIYEMLVSNRELEKFILGNPSITEVRDFAKDQGMTTLKQDGFLKVIDGLTTIEEVERIVGE